jgi:hypothetical protein
MRITEQGIPSFVSALFIVGIVGSAVPVGAGGTCGTRSLSTHLAAELNHGQLVQSRLRRRLRQHPPAGTGTVMVVSGAVQDGSLYGLSSSDSEAGYFADFMGANRPGNGQGTWK